jgi:hypothetical protein
MTGSLNADDNRAIRHRLKPALLAVSLCVLACPQAWSENTEQLRPTAAKPIKSAPHLPLLTRDEGSSIIDAALDGHLRRHGMDCSHLVHTVYERAGYSYAYADSSELYRGTGHFLRVKHPQVGDLVVWPGHVGIIFSPAQHTFFSALSHGPGTAKYDAHYWKRRGSARFFRYVKSDESTAALIPQ